VADFRLDVALREACEDDLKDSCGTNLKEMDGDEKLKLKGLQCLQV
jgi:Golgi apparatus protein 1